MSPRVVNNESDSYSAAVESDKSVTHSLEWCERPASPRCVIMAVSKDIGHHPFRASKAPAAIEPIPPELGCARRRRFAEIKSDLYSQHCGTSLEDMNDLIADLKVQHGSLDPRLGDVYNHIGTHHFHRDEYEAARIAFDRALDCYKRSYARRWRFFRGKGQCAAKENLDIAATFNNIGAVLWRSGKADAAITYLEQALQLQESAKEAGGRRDTEDVALQIAHTQYNLGGAQSLRGDHREAIRVLKLAKKTYENMLGPFHVEVARVDDALGAAFSLQGQYTKSLRCHQNALRIKGATLEVYDPSVRNSLMNVAAAYGRLGKFDKAEIFYKETRCALKLALYMTPEPTPEYVQAVMHDYDVTHILLEKTKWKSGLGLSMPTIEEEEGKGWES